MMPAMRATARASPFFKRATDDGGDGLGRCLEAGAGDGAALGRRLAADVDDVGLATVVEVGEGGIARHARPFRPSAG